jgi:hypothetical protein
MTKTTMTRAWKAAALYFGVAAGVALVAPAQAVAQTTENAPVDSQAAQAVQAPAQDVEPAVRVSEVGHSTSAWLDLQRSNAQAAPMVPTLGSEAGLAYRRYMESFNSKIPDLYGSALSGGGGSGGVSGGGSNGSLSGGGGLN